MLLRKISCAVAISVALMTNTNAVAEINSSTQPKNAVVVAAFGTTYDNTLSSLLNIQASIQRDYPNTEVRMAFTSNIIRKIWHRRASDDHYIAEHGKVPTSLYQVKNVLGTLADLQDEGYANIVVQPTHITHGEEYIDTKAIVDGLANIKTIKPKWQPFQKLALGRPLMGTWGAKYPYHNDMHALAIALKADIQQAKAEQRALIYMGHGNEHLSTGLYQELQNVMNDLYPDVRTFVGVVEGTPGLENIQQQLKIANVSQALLRPLMIVAGDHANNDMASDENDSWKTIIAQQGVDVKPVLEGLGDKAAIQAIFVSHMADAAKDAGIKLQ